MKKIVSSVALLLVMMTGCVTSPQLPERSLIMANASVVLRADTPVRCRRIVVTPECERYHAPDWRELYELYSSTQQ